MTKKKDVPPAEAPEAEIVNAAPETPETSSGVSTPEPPPPPSASGEAGPEKPENSPDTNQDIHQPPSEAAPSKNRRAIVRAGAGLNLRAGPGPSFEVSAILPDGAEVSVLTLLAEEGPQGSFEFRVPGWKYVFTGQMVGWVDSRFLGEVNDGQP